MKRNPGEWLRERLSGRIVDAVLLATFAVGWLCGALGVALGMALAGSLGAEWTLVLVLLPAAGFLVAALYRLVRGWRLPDMRKGASAEVAVGQAIEYVLTRDRCAVAHHVEEIAKVGDVDHLVATPRGPWVIETKHRRVPSSSFQETLCRIALNVEAVRDWAQHCTKTGR